MSRYIAIIKDGASQSLIKIDAEEKAMMPTPSMKYWRIVRKCYSVRSVKVKYVVLNSAEGDPAPTSLKI